jgi:5-(carboxyamino)imidazole ribonucleotide synthase
MKYEPKVMGIIGGGQLGRMTAMAAARIGITSHVYCPEENSPASQVCAKTFNGAYTDFKSLKQFADSVDCITYEFENIPLETIQYLQTLKPVYPDDNILRISQNRLIEKKFLNDIGIPTPRWIGATSSKELDKAFNALNINEFIAKTSTMGYDGKGQIKYRIGDNAKEAWAQLKTSEIIIEEIVDFACEVSVIIARDKLGQMAIYGPMLNEHENHILSKTTMPAPIPDELAERAREMAQLLAEALDLVGVLALELFITRDGQILANEMAPRPHNSGHWSIDACSVSQFEQHARTVCDLPIAPPGRHSDAVMINLIGSGVRKAGPWLEKQGACLHLYGKPEVREGRKMGHVTIISPMDKQIKISGF